MKASAEASSRSKNVDPAPTKASSKLPKHKKKSQLISKDDSTPTDDPWPSSGVHPSWFSSPKLIRISEATSASSPTVTAPSCMGSRETKPCDSITCSNHGGRSGTAAEASENSGAAASVRRHTGVDFRWEAIRLVNSKGYPISLSHFKLLKRIGYGDIGCVYLAELKGTNTMFAMKMMDKTSLASRNKLLRAQTEREILGLLDHPFLPSLYSHFETERLSCLVMEFCSGGNLHSLRHKQPDKHFTEKNARSNVRTQGTLASETILQGCMQPTAFLPRILPKKTHKSKLDLGTGNRALLELMAEPTDARSTSFVGTHEYLAPEIIRGDGHGSAVDWWTLGIFLYELVYGTTPFKGSGNRATLFNIVGQPLMFPEAPAVSVSVSARDLIRGLLEKEPEKRIGYRRGATEIKQHPFFDGVNWALVRSATPPYIPEPVDVRRLAHEEAVDKGKKGGASDDSSFQDFEVF
ncbi:hypothetical protein C4D60_Mb03t16970 [Musa balbisiana]|uniref:non-specific serine/threonine protein kinase n=1 Tax=Musa balbisiana TaxID=52838 RepID=A0A4S8JCW4_MUSBA|nr:hypothetical protein C4D60_Mb03t16970 [Musa balbisiana]